MLKEEKCPYCSASLEYDENNFSGEVECKYCHTKIMVIREGEYIRTKDGYIRKIIEDFSTDNSYFKLDKEKLTEYEFTYFYSDEIFKKEIKNHSFNIIDLIEEGDYVNGKEIEAIDYDEDEQGNLFDILGIIETDDDYAYPVELRKINIRTIVTKEEFKAMEYEVK